MRPWLRVAVLACSLGAWSSSACNTGARDLDGNKLFTDTCARCHGPDGRGEAAARVQLGVPDMTDPRWQAAHTDGDIRRTVVEGSKSKKMPPFGSFYNDAQLGLLVEQVRARGALRR
jgi:mono/diheme cytochrome c family protein